MKLQAARDKHPHLFITAPNGLADAQAERRAYTVAKYMQAVETDGKAWQAWAGVRDLICAGIACSPNTADSMINELCKAGQLEVTDRDDGRFIKIRLDVVT